MAQNMVLHLQEKQGVLEFEVNTMRIVQSSA